MKNAATAGLTRHNAATMKNQRAIDHSCDRVARVVEHAALNV